MGEDSARGARHRHRQFYRILTGMLLGTISGFLAVNAVAGSRTFSAAENRQLAQRPKLTRASVASGQYFRDFDAYYADQFVGRDFWMELKTDGALLLGRTEANGVYFGRGGALFQQPTAPAAAAVAATQAAINAFTEGHPDLRQTMVLVPDAAAVLPEELPKGAPVRDQKADVRQFVKGLNSGIRQVDAAAALAAGNQDQPVFYRTDHHWTSYGAYCVFRAAAADLGIDKVLPYAPHTVSERFQGTLASRSGRHHVYDAIDVYEPQGTDVRYLVRVPDTGAETASLFVREKLQEKDQYQLFLGGNHPLVEILTTANTGRNLLLFKDSYANSFVQFLTPYFDKIIMVDPRYYYENIGAAMTSYGITDVLYLYSADTLLADTGLADTLTACADGAERAAQGGDSQTAGEGAQGDSSQSAAPQQNQTEAVTAASSSQH